MSDSRDSEICGYLGGPGTVWGRQRRDEVLVDVDDVASGRESVMRWNDEATWTWSAEPAHEPLVTRHDFEAVQEIMRSNTRRRGPRTRTASTRPYALRGKLTCGICGRLMHAHQARGTHYYRCRYATEYAESAELAHPLNVYLREDDIVPQLDAWLDDLFAPDRIDDTIDRILDPEPDTEATRLRARLENELRQCDKQIAKCRALLDDDVDLATGSAWLKEAIANDPRTSPGGVPRLTRSREHLHLSEVKLFTRSSTAGVGGAIPVSTPRAVRRGVEYSPTLQRWLHSA